MEKRKSPLRIVLIGIQGAGKSTQGNLLSKKLGIPYLSTGHIFRNLAKEKTKLGRYIKEVMNAGYLVPDKKTLSIVKDYLQRDEYKNGYILDGFPRTLAQVEAFDEPIDKVIYLKVSDREALWRLSYRNGEVREDETLGAIRRRIELFHKVTEPVIDYYKKKGILVEIDGEREIEEINKDILEKLDYGA
jgi:adenylate kinase